MKVLESLRETEETLKCDVDVGPNWPEWWKLKTILNFLNFPDAEIYRANPSGSYHLESSLPSQMRIRRAIPDCRGRLYVSDRRFEMIGAYGDIIFWNGKSKFQFKKVKGKLVVLWVRKGGSDQKITLKDVLALPFKLNPPQHMKRRLRWWKRRLGLKKEETKLLKQKRR
jgi:hypothetical protein